MNATFNSINLFDLPLDKNDLSFETKASHKDKVSQFQSFSLNYDGVKNHPD